MTIFKSQKQADLEARVNELESQLGKPADRHFNAQSFTEFELESAKIMKIAAEARAFTKPAVIQKATPTPTASFVMPTAEAIAAEVIRQTAKKPLTGLALTASAFQTASAEKAATAKPAARNPEISSLTGLAKVTASFSAQAKSSN